MQVKICGITRADDARDSLDAGADAVGLNFVEGTPRCVDRATAREISALAAGRAVRVGVFRDAPPEEVRAIAREVGLDVVQLHGDESPEYARALAMPILRALPADDDLLERAAAFADADVLVDHPSGGGSGTGWDFERVRPLVAAGRRVWIAGGLSPETVADAVRRARPHGVDASSALECAPGEKDAARVRAFIESAHAAQAVSDLPNRSGYFGGFGGHFVSEALMPALDSLSAAWEVLRDDPDFWQELRAELATYAGRPTPLYFAPRVSEDLGVKVWLKREDLAHTGAHKINNVLGQALIAARTGKPRIIAETGAGQHGVATATACARRGLECDVYMGAKDVARQALNVFRMELLGARVIPVTSGSQSLKDAMNEALRDWATNVRHTYYVVGSTAGPHPYPMLVRDLQVVIGQEARAQFQESAGGLPDLLIACVGGGSNALGMFWPFRDDPDVAMVGVEAGGRGVERGPHGAPLSAGSPGVLHGSRSYVLQDDAGQIFEAHSLSAGLDYPGVGPEHAWMKDTGRAEYVPVTDDEALDAFVYLTRMEGIIPAFESAHAIAELRRRAPTLAPGTRVVVNVSGRGDKDVAQARDLLAGKLSVGERVKP